MKTLIKCLFVFCLFFGFQANAQQPGDSKVLASKTSVKGRHELKRENHVKKRERKNAKEQERKAFKKSPLNKHFNLGKKSRKRHSKKHKDAPKKEESKS
ncbi:MAG: hypothetical protein H0W61_10885 [Bacteroidetes bacterium]|nr:hypothetical protein [Bacteroidota bacterium]